MRPANSLFGTIGRDGTLTLHIPSAKFPIHYLVGSRTLVFLTKMRNGYLRRNQTTRMNTDTRILPLTFYEPDFQHRIAIRGVGGDAFNDFTNHLWDMGGIET